MTIFWMHSDEITMSLTKYPRFFISSRNSIFLWMNRNALYFETDTDYVSSFWNSEKFFVHIVDGHEILHQFWMVETRSKIMGCLTRFSTGDFAGPSTVFLIAGPGPGAHLGAPAKLPLDPGPAAALTVILTVPGDVENNDGERSGNHQVFFYG